jgi:hypothetical protein
VVAFFVCGLVATPLVFAKITFNTIDSTAIVSRNGRHIHFTGPISTDQPQPVFMPVTVTQRTTGAIAEGYATLIGNVPVQQWNVHAFSIGAKSFQPGRATAVALAQSRTIPGGADDVHQWLVNVTREGD